jgi:hypothetical protein
MRKLLTVAVVAMAAIGVVSMVRAAEPKEIKEVMKEAHGGKNSLLKKVLSGKSEKEEREKLLALYKDLAADMPEKGSKDSWEKMTKAIVVAAEAVVDKGDAASLKKLSTATNCKACHTVHK